tara:strand:+ start:630 stop:1130 length:501 start_codon:yes stop_codon:yes gene_type:complete
MFKKFSINNLLSIIIVVVIFLIDRMSKLYVLKLVEKNNNLDIYVTPYLNIYLIWNKGIAFGLLSFNEYFFYNSMTIIIFIITMVILVMIIRTKGFTRHSLLLVLGGSLGNLFDRLYYKAVPDFIDFHIQGFHWFIFNIADIFITTGVLCLIYAELFINKRENEKFN